MIPLNSSLHDTLIYLNLNFNTIVYLNYSIDFLDFNIFFNVNLQ